MACRANAPTDANLLTLLLETGSERWGTDTPGPGPGCRLPVVSASPGCDIARPSMTDGVQPTTKGPRNRHAE